MKRLAIALAIIVILLTVASAHADVDTCKVWGRVFVDLNYDGIKNAAEPWAAADVPVALSTPRLRFPVGVTTIAGGHFGNQVWAAHCAEQWTATWANGREPVQPTPLSDWTQPALIPWQLPYTFAPASITNGCSLSVVVFTDIDGDGAYGLLDIPAPYALVRFDGIDHDVTLAMNEDGFGAITAKCGSSWRVSYPHGVTVARAGLAAVAVPLPAQPYNTFFGMVTK